MKLEPMLEKRKDEILRISSQYGARNVRIFGSRARKDSSETSDLDILVEMQPNSTLLDLVAIKQDLEDLLGCKVDVVTESSLSPYIKDDILKEAVSL
jgi:predicted nucleotidyltransferase